MRCLVLGARRYSFRSDDGERVEGVTLHYLTLDGERDTPTDDDQVGEIPFSVSAPISLFPELRSAPAYYDVDFRQRPGRGGRPTLQAAGVSYLGAAHVTNGAGEVSPE